MENLCNLFYKKYSLNFYQECAEYLKTHSLKETSERYNIKYATLKQNLIKYGFRKPNRKINKIKINYNDHYFDNIDTEHKAYFLGFLFADGCVCKTAYKYQMQLCVQLQDDYILYILKDEMRISTKIYKYKNSSKLCIICTDHLKDVLFNLGLKEDKSRKSLNISNNIPNHLIRHFIRGVFDGDGCITIKRTGFSVTSICSNSINFLEDIKKYLNYNNIENIHIRPEKGKRKNILYILYISRKDNQNQFKNYIYNYSSIYLKRKFDKFKLIPC